MATMTFAWPVTFETPLEHIAVLGFLTEKQHQALAETGMGLEQVADAISLPVKQTSTYGSAQDYSEVQRRICFLAACGWDVRARTILPILSEAKLLDSEYTPEQATVLVSAEVTELWVRTAVEMKLDWNSITTAAAGGLPVEYLRSLADE